MTDRRTEVSAATTAEAARSPGRNPYLFIVGCPRSGTTLLQRMVDSHPWIAITPETHWIPRFAKTGGGRVTPELVSRLSGYHRFPSLGIARKTLDERVSSGDPPTYAEFVTAIFDRYAQNTGKPLSGDKTPAYVRKIPTLHALWPGAKYVHLIRDGRDVCLSLSSWDKAARAAGRFVTWGEDPVSTTALWWRWNVLLGREAGRALGPRLYHEVRYEALTSRPTDECAAICAFLGLPYDDAMLRFHEGRAKRDPGLSAKKAWLPVTSGLRDWRSQMPDDHVERFEAAAGDLLEELGYPLAVRGPSRETLDNAARVRDAFTRDVLRRGKQLPAGW